MRDERAAPVEAAATGAERTRWTAAAAAALTIAAGLGVRAFGGGDVAKDAGVALYAVLVLWLVVLVAPRIRAVLAGVIAFALSAAVELFQLTRIPAQLAGHPLARLILGTTFHGPDLAWYAVGAAAGALLLAAVRRRG
ncbi:DUF2809 domain-containing protein [Microbacterium sediminis]|uniref:Uncharacterized protein n=1 Tax=Microbacterium sediminis TaxID=904291 RepID=A0A1B9NB45_9MICO|nr:DUF2809 domain-containing protein [Microbacterium sediminis]OCG73832.1 hypothetical protein A7J15_06325 [Microbacterium sediminis]QBR74578.1 DUF2809 domain-containing protein [Microbacterium sediminis]